MPTNVDPIRDATGTLLFRYVSIIERASEKSTNHKALASLCYRALLALETEPLDKLSRTAGFLLGSILERGLADPRVEHEFSRDLFQEVYDRL